MSGKCPECERLRALVNEWPKTGDGVPITPQMTVYHPDGEKYTARLVEYCYFNALGVEWESCYSTPEAARAAKGGGP